MSPELIAEAKNPSPETVRRVQRGAALAQESAAEADRRAALWQLFVMADADVPLALNVPPSLWNQCKTLGDTPPLFTIGRRLFVLTADLREWLTGKAKLHGAPGSKRLRKLAAKESA